eukprot:gene23777-28506_t
MVWPSPEAVSLTLHAGALELPSRDLATGDEWTFPEPEAASPWQLDILRKGTNSRRIEHDQVSGRIILSIEDDFGEARDKEHGLVHGSVARERWEIHADDPLSANFHLTGRIEAYENDELVFERNFAETIARQYI